MKIKYTFIKIKKYIKKYIDAILFIASAVLLFGHIPRYFKLIERLTAWYLKDFCLHLAIFSLAILLCKREQDSRAKRLLFWGAWFICLKTGISMLDTLLSYYFDFHIHKTILLLQYFPLAYIALKAYCDYRKGDTKNDAN